MYPKKKKRRRKLKRYNVFVLVLTLILIFLIGINTTIIAMYDVLPYKYLLLYLVFVIGVPLILIQFMVRKRVRWHTKIISISFVIVFIVLLGFLLYYLYNTFSFLDAFSNYSYVTHNYKVLVPSNSEYQELNDINDKNLGYITLVNMDYSKAIKELNKKVKVNSKDYLDYTTLVEALNLKQIETVLLTDSYYDILKEEYDDFETNYRVIFEFSIREKANNLAKEIDVTKDTFNIFISGMDTAGVISSISRSDVNILITVNPKTNQILMLHIPRDYYVTFHGLEDRDKLTHSGLYGTEMTIKTIEDMLDIDINYYFKVNFDTVVQVVDALGGVDVYSKYSFKAVDHGYYFKQGYNRVNGQKALDFVRTRKVLPGGDIARGENQLAMLQAIVKKASSPAILMKYTQLLDSLKAGFLTNMSTDKIMDIIKMQIDKMPSWNFTSINLTGYGSEDYTSVFPDRKVYVMEPLQESIDNAKNAIKEVMDDKKLENSYTESDGNVNIPTVVKPTTPKKEETTTDKNKDKEETKKDEDEKETDKKDDSTSSNKDENADKNTDTSTNQDTNKNPDDNISQDENLNDDQTKDDEEKDTNQDTENNDDNTLQDNGLVPTN